MGDCTPSDLDEISNGNGHARIGVNGATTGRVLIVSVKYDSGTVVGTPVPNPTATHYNFPSLVDGAEVDKDLDGLDLKKKGGP